MIEIFISKLIPYLVLIETVLVIGLSLMFLFRKKILRSNGFFNETYSFIAKNYLGIGFIFSLSAMTGSLFYSEVVSLTPCVLCWYQRMFMYPQVAIFGLAIWNKYKKITGIMIPLSVIGALFAAYHYSLQFFLSGESIFCLQGAASCSSIDVIEFGFVTIPYMALITFAFLILIGLITRTKK